MPFSRDRFLYRKEKKKEIASIENAISNFENELEAELFNGFVTLTGVSLAF